jgi:hypothetical protein
MKNEQLKSGNERSLTLTPALSHPMGEGEVVPVQEEN